MWIILVLLNPILDSVRSVISKRASKSIDSYMVSWANNLIPTILFTPLLFFIDLQFNDEFIISLAISGSINIIAVILYHRAVMKSDISVVIPMLSFTPLFMLITSPFLVDEFPNEYGLLGVLSIVSGSYLLNIKTSGKGLFAPFKALYDNKGTRYMLITAFLFSISANFDKRAVLASSPWQYIVFLNLIIFIGVSVFLMFNRKFSLKDVILERKNLFIISLFTAIVFVVHMLAIELTLAVYVVTVKRLNGVFAVMLGSVFLSEGKIRERLLGASLMFIGVLLITLFH